VAAQTSGMPEGGSANWNKASEGARMGGPGNASPADEEREKGRESGDRAGAAIQGLLREQEKRILTEVSLPAGLRRSRT